MKMLLYSSSLSCDVWKPVKEAVGCCEQGSETCALGLEAVAYASYTGGVSSNPVWVGFRYSEKLRSKHSNLRGHFPPHLPFT
jgi:hypothetical protein